MKATIKEEQGLKRKLEFIIPLDQVDKRFSDQFQKIQKTAKMSGFREGKVPMETIKQNFYDKAWKAVMDDLFQSFYPKALNESQLNPAGQPMLMDIQLEEKKDCKFLVEIEVHPKVEVKNYLKLKVKKIDTEVTEKHVLESLDRLRESFAEFKDSLETRPTKKGDVIVIDMQGFLNSAPIKELSHKELMLDLGTDRLAPGFDNNLMGLNIGQEKKFDFQLPKDNPYQSLAGKLLTFQVTLKSLKVKKLPELNDDLAKKFKIETFSELKEKIKKDLEDMNKQKAKEKQEEEVINQLVENNPIDLPQSLIADQKKRLIENSKKRLESYQMKPAQQEVWIKEQDAEFEKEAKFSLQASYLIEHLIQDLKITATEQDIEKSLKESFPNKPAKEMEQELKKNNYWSHFLFNLTRQKVIALLLEKADMVS